MKNENKMSEELKKELINFGQELEYAISQCNKSGIVEGIDNLLSDFATRRAKILAKYEVKTLINEMQSELQFNNEEMAKSLIIANKFCASSKEAGETYGGVESMIVDEYAKKIEDVLQGDKSIIDELWRDKDIKQLLNDDEYFPEIWERLVG